MTTLRAFIAIELDDGIKAGLGSVQRRLRAEPISGFVRWVAPGSIHLTLKFLGDMDTARVSPVLCALQTACTGVPPFELAVRGAGCFPTFQHPNVIWAGLVGQVQVASQLAERIEAECVRLGFDREERPFSPHLTLGRVNRDAGPAERRQLGDLVRKLEVSQVGVIHAEIVHLMRSELRPLGSVYTSLGDVRLVE